MLKSYLKVALRNIARHKSFSVLNALGLALGMSVSLLLISFYAYVSSFDDFHTKRGNIYRVISTLKTSARRDDLASAPAALAKKLQHDNAGIREIIRINASFSGEIVSDKLNLPFQGYYADANFFTVFDFDVTRGNPRTALSKPNSIVLTEALAKKIVASGDLLGHVIEVEGVGTFEVTGIIKDQRRTHLSFEALISFSTLPADIQGEESNADQWTKYKDQYLYLLAGDTPDNEKLQLSLDRAAKEVNSQLHSATITFKLQPLGDITPGPDLENSTGPDTDYTLIVVFGTICLLILLPSCFNYANISIARALKRSKEIGLRKTMGGAKHQVFLQFITETVAITTISLAGAIIIFMLIRPGFEDMMPGSWLDLSLTWQMVGMFLLFAIAVGLLAGVFPALHFAGLNPIQALKGKSTSKGISRMRLRKVLTTFQFALSFCFIVLLIVFSRQYRYNLNFNYGFNTDNILDVELQGVDPAIFKSEFSRLSAVQDLSMSSGILGFSFSSTMVREQTNADSLKVFQLFVDPSYISNMGLQLLAGQSFPDVSPGQERHIVVNEEFLRAWQIASPADAIGKTFVVDGKTLEVAGVLKNFHFAPLQIPIKSFFLRTDPSQYTHANVKVASSDIYAALAAMEKIWSKLSDTRKFEAHFFDDEMEMLYQFYWALLKLIGYLGLLAISISLLGLLGMVIYTTESRMKEAGIRKVFGASEASLTFLLSKDFLKLMVWAIGCAIPVCVLLFDNFLSSIQYYRVSISAWDILSGIIIFFVVGVVTIASQTRKAAGANPVDTLRYE
jgi:putative ABC transport system permease protein